jgi:hypothetical protein
MVAEYLQNQRFVRPAELVGLEAESKGAFDAGPINRPPKDYLNEFQIQKAEQEIAEQEQLKALEAGAVPSSYLAALSAAQERDRMAAGFAGGLAGVEQAAQIASRGLYRPIGMPRAPSAVAEVEQRQRAVQDFLNQRRAEATAAIDAEYKRGLLARMAQPRVIGKTEEELELIGERAETERARQESLRREPKSRAVARVAPKAERIPSQAPTREERITTGLRREFEAQPAVKSFGDVQAAFGKVSEASKGGSPASDLSMLYSYAKLLDPGSVVRESEFQTMAQTGAFGDKVAAAVKKVAVGERLTEAQRADFVKAARQQLSVYEKQFNETANRYETLAKKSNVEPEDVVFRRAAFLDGDKSAAAPSKVKVRRKSDGKIVEIPSTSVQQLVAAGAVEVVP